jgi:hypothetical protein
MKLGVIPSGHSPDPAAASDITDIEMIVPTTADSRKRKGIPNELVQYR